MANTGEIQDLTVSWEGYAGTSVEAFIKKEFTSVFSGDVGIPVENYITTGSIMPISKVYTLDGLCVTPIVENFSGVLNNTKTIYFPHFYKESGFEETEKLEFYQFQFNDGRWGELGYHYMGIEDNLPSWVIGQIISKLPTVTTSSNGLMSSTDKTKLDNAVTVQSQSFTTAQKSQARTNIGAAATTTATTSANGLMSSTDKGKLDKAVTVQPQTFTDEQKAQAQSNIGIIIDDDPTYNSQNLVKSGGVKASIDYVYINCVGVRAQDYFTDEQKTQARTNISAASESALNTLSNTKANSSDVYTKTQTNNLLNNKVDKVTGKGLSTNDFKVIELTNYLTEGDTLPTDNNLIYVYYGKVVEKRMCDVDADNAAILFIIDRNVTDYELNNLTVLGYIKSGGGDYGYEYEETYHTNHLDCPTWVKAACGVSYADSENAGLMSPSMYDDLSDCQKKQITRTIDGSTLKSATLNVGYDYIVTGSLNTFTFILPDSVTNGEISILCTTGATPDISFFTSLNTYVDSSFYIEANSTYEISIRAFQNNYYIALVKMTTYSNNISPNRIITYNSTRKLNETQSTDQVGSELHVNSFNANIISHTFANGVGTIVFDDDVTIIDNYAFYSCTDILRSVTIPATVEEINSSAFSNCDTLSSLTCLGTVAPTVNSAFYGVAQNGKVYVPTSSTGYDSSTFMGEITDEGSLTYNDWTVVEQ